MVDYVYVGINRHTTTNNRCVPDSDPSQPEKLYHVLDANNLYGHSMRQPLPYKNLQWDIEVDIETVLITSDDDGSTGYVVEVELEFPLELHDKFKEFPPCGESTTPKLN